jgi:enoyl-CoA hydratase
MFELFSSRVQRIRLMGSVLLQVNGNVAIVTLSAPAVKNAFDFKMCEDLLHICDRVSADTSIGAAVLQGDGGTFCSGSDTREPEWTSGGDAASDESFERTSLIYSVFLRVAQLGVPTIAAVRGSAVGAGVNLALACDVRIVARDAQFLGGFMSAGVLPGGGFYSFVSRLGGREAAVAMGIMKETVTGDRAVDLGLAWAAVDDDQVERTALVIAQSCATDPALSRKAISVFRIEMGPPALPLEAAAELERAAQMWSRRRRYDTIDRVRDV